ncbi:MAG: hypothetical protein NT169_04895 [Chloroflexi bacterium]|nr:hypothetical protein [Chloroflexota bacterium]
MKSQKGYIGLGILLVAVGILFLLQNFNVLGPFENLVWVLLFGAGGLAFLFVVLTNHEHWWAVIPGFTLLGLAALIGFGEHLGALGGALFLGAIGLSFWVIYAMRREFWWAVIPGGTLLTLAVVAALGEVIPGEVVGGIFFLGLAATFGLVYLLPTPRGRMKWAWIPAAVLGIMGLLLIVTLGGWINIIWPIALIAAGAYVLYRTFVGRRS